VVVARVQGDQVAWVYEMMDAGEAYVVMIRRGK